MADVPARDFEEFARPHLKVMSAVAVRYAGVDDAADVVQEALLRGWRRWSTFDQARGSARTWLVAIVLDQCRRSRKLRARRRTTLSAIEQRRSGPTEAAHRLDIEWALRSLPRRQREAATLYYLADLSVQDTAKLMSVSEGTVKAALSAARSALRTRLENP
ncbi:MAG: RNA polymerase sigma factor [Jatrophihabitans sp.]